MVSSVYNYYLSQYGNRTFAKYDTHKKTDLKNTYNKIMKINRDAPVYKVDLSEEAQRYAIDLKEHARAFGNIAATLSDADNGEILLKKSAVSSNSDCVDAEYIGDSKNPPTDSIAIDIEQLATPQVNTGKYLSPSFRHLSSGEYSFDLNINDLTYEFQFNVSNTDNTGDIQNKLARLINRSNVGIKAEVLTDSADRTALSLTSDATGISPMGPTLFSVSNNSNSAVDAVDALGLDQVTQLPSNAIFTVDGEQKSSRSNTFTIANSFEINLKAVNQPGEPTMVSLQTDSSDILDNIEELISGYNDMISVTNNTENERFDGTLRLRRAFSSISHAYGEMLNNNGLDIQSDGSIEVNKDKISEAVSEGRINDVFSSLGKFKSAIQSKAEDIALNPMDYVNNKIVAYKNPFRSFTAPYVSSAYSGMMFNGYV